MVHLTKFHKNLSIKKTMLETWREIFLCQKLLKDKKVRKINMDLEFY